MMSITGWIFIGIFVLGCFVGAIVGIFVLALCQVAGDADRRMGLK